MMWRDGLLSPWALCMYTHSQYLLYMHITNNNFSSHHYRLMTIISNLNKIVILMLFIVINGNVNMRKETAWESQHSIIISFFLHSINDVKNILWNKSLWNSQLPKLLKLTPSKSKIHNTLSLHNKVAKLQKNA